ncbi:MAG: nuclear transport factor 2 family protein [Sphingomonadales bacterium]|jgi:ketosteroid isomerase-like protein|nr:MAG: nuclear transport factor 2 family protein [Sphingomonadales bacterium]
MSEANKKVALEFIDSMGRGDEAAFAACLTPDSFALAKGYAQVSGRREHDEMVATAAGFKHIAPEGFKPVIRSVTAEGDRVAVEWEGQATLANGTPYHNQYLMLFTLRDGKIAQVNEYFCTKLADEAIWPLIAKFRQ